MVLALIALAVIATACSNAGPQDSLHPAGHTSRNQLALFVPVFWIAVGIFVVVEGLVLYISFNFREHRVKGEPVQVHGNTKMEIGWTLAPAVLLAAIAVPTVAGVFALAAVPHGPEVVHVRVVGHQWWWEYEYLDTKPVVRTATEMVIPAGKKVYVDITSADVIHSFWVPKLAGKQDAVPNRLNHLTLDADQPGTYFGQCAEFCALSHTNMKLRVVAKSPADYAAWLENQKKEAMMPAGGLAAAGAKVFTEFSTKSGSCIGCHTLRGIPAAQGRIGPELTHFFSRSTFAGSILDVNAENLTKWLQNPPGIKPGSIMPNYHIPQDAIQQLVAFLLSLK
ncbi:MAG: cytochrome c oxidase subunit II [Actinomycetota bacterium]